MPVSVSVPDPTLVRPVGASSTIEPPKVVDELSEPVVNVAAAAPAFPTVPAPASEPTVWLKPFRSNEPPAPTTNALADENVLLAPAFNVPPLMLVAPE